MNTSNSHSGNSRNESWLNNLSVEDIISESMQVIALNCGIHDAISLMMNLPGIKIFIPKKSKKLKELQYIKQNFTGNNISAIAIHLGKNRDEIERLVKHNIGKITYDDIFFSSDMKLVSSKCGRDVAIRLILNQDKFFGNRLYIPKNGFLIAQEKYIQRNFSGSNIKELALECGLTDRSIYKIVSKMYHQKQYRN